MSEIPRDKLWFQKKFIQVDKIIKAVSIHVWYETSKTIISPQSSLPELRSSQVAKPNSYFTAEAGATTDWLQCKKLGKLDFIPGSGI